MMFQTLLSPDCTFSAVAGRSKKRILEKIAEVAADKISNSSAHELLESLMVRERMGSTGIGGGIAIPHGRLSNTNDVVCVMLTSEKPVEFDAIDNRPVDIFIALFVPEDSCKQHISTLQSIAKVFSDKEICKQARRCESDQALFNLIQQQS